MRKPRFITTIALIVALFVASACSAEPVSSTPEPTPTPTAIEVTATPATNVDFVVVKDGTKVCDTRIVMSTPLTVTKGVYAPYITVSLIPREGRGGSEVLFIAHQGTKGIPYTSIIVNGTSAFPAPASVAVETRVWLDKSTFGDVTSVALCGGGM